MDERRRMLLAVGIVEWADAITQLHILGEYGEAWHQVVGEFQHLILQWPGVETTTPQEAERVVDEASAFITQRLTQLDELLSDE